MTVDAKVIEIQESKIIYGLIDQNGKCGTGSCEGCKCSTGIKKIALPRDLLDQPALGEVVEIQETGSRLIHFGLIILLPLIVLALTQVLPVCSSWVWRQTE